MKYKVYVEYTIADEYVEQYKNIVHDIEKKLQHTWRVAQFGLYESVTQKNKFVEEFFVSDLDTFEAIKNSRTNIENDEWKSLYQFLPEGRKKINVWTFMKIV